MHGNEDEFAEVVNPKIAKFVGQVCWETFSCGNDTGVPGF
jgi:hypothetical protein